MQQAFLLQFLFWAVYFSWHSLNIFPVSHKMGKEQSLYTVLNNSNVFPPLKSESLPSQHYNGHKRSFWISSINSMHSFLELLQQRYSSNRSEGRQHFCPCMKVFAVLIWEMWHIIDKRGKQTLFGKSKQKKKYEWGMFKKKTNTPLKIFGGSQKDISWLLYDYLNLTNNKDRGHGSKSKVVQETWRPRTCGRYRQSASDGGEQSPWQQQQPCWRGDARWWNIHSQETVWKTKVCWRWLSASSALPPALLSETHARTISTVNCIKLPFFPVVYPAAARQSPLVLALW